MSEKKKPGKPTKKTGAKHTSAIQVKETIREMIADNRGLKNTKLGAPTKYTEELGAEICLRIAEGESLRRICRDEHMVAKSTVLRWTLFCNDEYHHKCPELREKLTIFKDHYDHARIMQAEGFVDETVDISDDSSDDIEIRTSKSGEEFEVPNNEFMNRSKLRVETRKWLGEVYLPKIQAMKNRNIEINSKTPVILQFDQQDKDA